MSGFFIVSIHFVTIGILSHDLQNKNLSCRHKEKRRHARVISFHSYDRSRTFHVALERFWLLAHCAAVAAHFLGLVVVDLAVDLARGRAARSGCHCTTPRTHSTPPEQEPTSGPLAIRRSEVWRVWRGGGDDADDLQSRCECFAFCC